MEIYTHKGLTVFKVVVANLGHTLLFARILLQYGSILWVTLGVLQLAIHQVLVVWKNAPGIQFSYFNHSLFVRNLPFA
jgi:hypothetical protein